jgi:hypothetical protein
MKELKRRDVILLALMTLSCAMLAVSRPDNTDIRTVVWDYTAFLMMGATAIWFLTEISSWLGEAIIGSPIPDISRGMSKNGLVVLAHKEGIADKETLEGLTEEDLITLIKTNGKSNGGAKPTLFVVTSGVWSLIKDVVHAIVNKYRKLISVIKGVFNRKKQKKALGRGNVKRKR